MLLALKCKPILIIILLTPQIALVEALTFSFAVRQSCALKCLVERFPESSLERVNLNLVHVPNTGGSIDVLAESVNDLLLRLGNAHKGAAHEVPLGRVITLRSLIEKST